MEEESGDEMLGPCPGWLRPPLLFPDMSAYDGCMTILLDNGTIVSQVRIGDTNTPDVSSQSGVVHSTCLEYKQIASSYIDEVVWAILWGTSALLHSGVQHVG